MDGQSDLDKYRLEWESDDQWLLRKSFIARHWGKYKSINRLICLSQIFINVEFLGCRYNQGVMDEVISLSAGLSDARRDERRKVIEKTFVRGGQLQQETSNSSGTVNSGRRNYHGRSAAAVVVDDSSNAGKTKNPFVSPAPKRARESLDIQEEPKSPLLLKKEKSVIGLRAVLTVVSDPASKKLSRQPVPDSPRELLNHVCNREKVSWRLDVAERKEPVVEYFLSVNDILLVHQFCFSKEEAMNLGCTAALQCLKSVCLDTREEESNGGLLKFALYTSKDKRLGWSGPDDDLFAVLYQKFDIVSRKFANSDEKAEDAFEDFESFCKKEMIPFEIGTQQKSGPNQELFMSVAGVSVSYLNLQGKDLEPGRAGENKRKLCSGCLMALRKKFRRIYEADNGELRLISADQEVTDEFIRLALANQGKGGRETGDANVVDLSTNSKSRIPSSCAECESGGCTVFPQLISKFIIKHGFNEEISLEKAKGIFIQSAAFSGLNYEFDTYLEDSGGGYRSRLSISGLPFTVSENTWNSGKQAEAEACFAALTKLKLHCFTIKQKGQIDKSQKEIGTDISGGKGAAEYPSIPASNVGKKLLEKMGWSGGGIGKTEQGIREPISVQEVFAREGLGRAASCGVGKTFTNAVETILRDYVGSNQQEDLVFASDFSNEQRKHIHQLCRKMNLKSVSFGKDSERQLTVQKKKTAQQLLLLLLENNGENGKFLVVPPGVDQEC